MNNKKHRAKIHPTLTSLLDTIKERSFGRSVSFTQPAPKPFYIKETIQESIGDLNLDHTHNRSHEEQEQQQSQVQEQSQSQEQQQSQVQEQKQSQSQVQLVVDPSLKQPQDLSPTTPVDNIILNNTTPEKKITIRSLPEMPTFKRVTIKDVNQYIEEMYTQEETVLSTSLDILALYLKSQKILYIEAKVYCEQQLNYLMLPAILISALCTVLSLGLATNPSGPVIISSLTACNSFLLSLISYLKLDAKAEAHKTSAYQFDKLQSITEFNSGKVMFFNSDKMKAVHEDNHGSNAVASPTAAAAAAVSPLMAKGAAEDIENKRPTKMSEEIVILVHEIETKVNEIKEMNKFILPEKIRQNYKNTYHQNIFSTIKKVQTEEIRLRTKLQNKINEINEADNYYNYNIQHSQVLDPEMGKPEYLQEKRKSIIVIKKERDMILEEIIQLRDKYIEQDYAIVRELQYNNRRKRCDCFQWLKT